MLVLLIMIAASLDSPIEQKPDETISISNSTESTETLPTLTDPTVSEAFAPVTIPPENPAPTVLTTQPSIQPPEKVYTVCIDAGYQKEGIPEKEPNGPGSTGMKAKLTSGMQGVVTGIEEYKLNLEVSLLLEQELLTRGYKVVMIRCDHDCKIPVTIVEMGYMSNPEEDRKMATQEYRQRMVDGIADGVDAYFGGE